MSWSMLFETPWSMIGAVAVPLSILVDWLRSFIMNVAGAVAEFIPVCNT